MVHSTAILNLNNSPLFMRNQDSSVVDSSTDDALLCTMYCTPIRETGGFASKDIWSCSSPVLVVSNIQLRRGISRANTEPPTCRPFVAYSMVLLASDHRQLAICGWKVSSRHSTKQLHITVKTPIEVGRSETVKGYTTELKSLNVLMHVQDHL